MSMTPQTRISDTPTANSASAAMSATSQVTAFDGFMETLLRLQPIGHGRLQPGQAAPPRLAMASKISCNGSIPHQAPGGESKQPSGVKKASQHPPTRLI